MGQNILSFFFDALCILIGTFLLGFKMKYFCLMLQPSNLVCTKIEKKEGLSDKVVLLTVVDLAFAFPPGCPIEALS